MAISSSLRGLLASLVLLAPLTLLAVVAGCGGEFHIAPVAGVVTLDGKPLENAVVFFQPQLQGEGTLVGPASMGVTDAEGKFRLQTIHGEKGAVVGPHMVSVSTYESRLVDPKNSDRIEVVSKEIVPAKYRNPSELRFEVPSGGASDAKFDLAAK